MTRKKLLLVIVTSLAIYAIITILYKSEEGHNSLMTRFIEDYNYDADNDERQAKVSRTIKMKTSAGLGEKASLITIRNKYNASLPADSYSITRGAETGNELHSTVPTKSITQLEMEATIANTMGEPAKRFPTTLIIGVRKAGTRALLAILRLHPHVKSSGPEVHYFDLRYPRGLHWYLEQTPKVLAGQQTIEKTPSYFVVKGVPKRVLEYSKAINKTLKFLVILRDPTIRAISDYVQLNIVSQVKYHRILKPFEEMAIKNNSAFEVNTSWGVIKTGVYYKHFQRWLRFFPPEWFHFVSCEELVRSPLQEIKKVEKFLGLEPYFTKNNFVYNLEKGFPCFRSAANKNERCLGKAKGRPHPKIDPIVLSELRNYYRPFNKQLYRIVGRDFQWP